MVNDTDVILEWLPVPDVMERTGASLQQVKRWLQDRELIGRRRGENNALMVPVTFLTQDGPLPSLRGLPALRELKAHNNLLQGPLPSWRHLSQLERVVCCQPSANACCSAALPGQPASVRAQT